MTDKKIETSDDLDELDLRILAEFSHQKTYKKHMHRILESKFVRESSNGNDNYYSIQTIGRRIDQLRKAGFLESCVMESDLAHRDLIFGFYLSDKGETLMENINICMNCQKHREGESDNPCVSHELENYLEFYEEEHGFGTQ